VVICCNFFNNDPCLKDTKNIEVPIIQLDMTDTVYVDSLAFQNTNLPATQPKVIEDYGFLWYMIVSVSLIGVLLCMITFVRRIDSFLNRLDEKTNE
jgi:hypothetical protein